jgi:hypothetical protein
MHFWNNIINTALIGTDKRQLAADDLTEELAEPFELINAEENIDKEEKFLQAASVAYNFRQSGAGAISNADVAMALAPIEESSYAKSVAINVLKDILEESSNGLLSLWLYECSKKNCVVTPELVPSLLDVAINQKTLRQLIVQCCGKRGAWLSGFNPAWNFSASTSDEELWQTGTPEQRKLVLQQIRATDAAKGREWLQQTWAEENANSKTELLKQLTVNISTDDIEWLETLLTEKSQKVKDQALELLKQIPESSIVKQYQEVLAQTITIKKEKSFLGMISKTSLHTEPPRIIPEDIFKTGIEKLSNSKDFTDDEYLIFQLIKSVPPSFWESHLSLNPETIIQTFQKEKDYKKYIPAFVLAITRFKDTRWAIAFMQHSDVFYIDIIPFLPIQQQDHYSIKFFDQHEKNIIQYATMRESEWSLDLTKAFFTYFAKNPYNYSRTFYNQYIHLIPTAITSELEKYQPSEEYYKTMWSNTSDYITRLVNLKLQTIKAFNS